VQAQVPRFGDTAALYQALGGASNGVAASLDLVAVR
jgi:hypothetical protein